MRSFQARISVFGESRELSTSKHNTERPEPTGIIALWGRVLSGELRASIVGAGSSEINERKLATF
jgi:hypothetical protein